MSVKKKDSRERKASRWAANLMKSVRAVLAAHPEADPDNVRHTLILLEQPPLERLRRSLTRGRALAQRKSRQWPYYATLPPNRYGAAVGDVDR